MKISGVPLWGEHLGTPIGSRIQISADSDTARARSIWNFQPLGAKARAMPVDFSDTLDVKPVH
jgi:hypothetical protein